MAFWEILGPQQHFHTPWIGNKTLNTYGLHKARIQLASLNMALRRLFFQRPGGYKEFLTEGIITVPNFLDDETFKILKTEVRTRCDDIESRYPVHPSQIKGFGEKMTFDGGFDRYDGGTLNRFIHIDKSTTPNTSAFIANHQLRTYYQKTAGCLPHDDNLMIYQTIYGDESAHPDIQAKIHRDTFQPAVKLWYFINAVEPQHGPFEYVPGSHLMTSKRMEWEHQKSILASTPGEHSGGSFRIDHEELGKLGLPKPDAFPVKANTLVLADIRGFHRRGDASPGARRLAIYGNFRPHPFIPVPH